MKVTNFKKVFCFLLFLMISCNPCDNENGDPEESNYIFYQTNENLIFRLDYEDFLVQNVSENYFLGESQFKDQNLIYKSDTIFLVNSFSLEQSLLLDNVPGIEFSQCILNEMGNIIVLKSLNNELYKSDISGSLEFLFRNLSNEDIYLNRNLVYFWEENPDKRLKSININNSNELSRDLKLDRENISSFTCDNDFLYFTNYNSLESKLFKLNLNLSIVDTTKIFEKGNISPIVLDNDLLFYDDNYIYNEDMDILYSTDENYQIVNIYYNRNLNLSFLYVKDKFTDFQDIYYFKYNSEQEISNLILLINNAEKVN